LFVVQVAHCVAYGAGVGADDFESERGSRLCPF
jgi:hypothetical protein